jgi:hypothetical protein
MSPIPELTTTPESTSEPSPKPPISEARRLANIRNAQRSSGPTSEEGKRRSSLNATSHGLTGRTVILLGDDLEKYRAFVQSYLDEHQPVGPTESTLTHALADTGWRLDRFFSTLDGVNALAILDPSSSHSEIPVPQLHATLAEADEYLMEQKTFNNISLYLTRLQRLYERTLKQLKQLQAERKTKEEAALEEAVLLARYHKMINEPFDPSAFGFDFSPEKISGK